ncbi:glycoside hydrolase family 20 protein [Flaviaesturariibacter aridisoli]|uniref:beta-N-acetylhexosaminidase n=1 Tax=Flaviaesturariibacter aridisoli TaxID=2545761 RepID=A0A4R4E844_9BACT|nr:family 20 glycosylhydrolase [Flaviaesturariibacter aridisoli]TCZ73948.1 beta-N-acetylhexosaminidase [Flaviaesturariibacter aridisoli]
MIRCLLAAFSLLLSSALLAQTPALVPQPVDLRMGRGTFTLSPATMLVARDAEEARIAALFNDYLQRYYGFRLKTAKEASSPAVRFVTRRFIKAPDKDGYGLLIDGQGVRVEGDTYPGLFYGLQTLIQLLPAPAASPAAAAQTAGAKEVKVKEKPGKSKTKATGVTANYKLQPANSKLSLPQLSIADYPRFAYRGMHLDVCRHFFPVSFIKTYIDILAAHKMNTFHWHLTDDQGWRIEIRKFPELTATGAWRHGTIVGRYPGTGNDNLRYGGYYSQEEVREVIRYARERYISVIPEIEMPGHASAAIAAYPYLSCFPAEPTQIASWPSEGSKRAQAAGKPKQVQETWGVIYDIMCAGKDSTFQFLEAVLDEVLSLFPDRYVHIGGDEAPKSNWKRCPHCQARMKAEGLKDEHELQSYFIRRIDNYVSSKGKQIIGWDEILEGGLSPNAIVMSWQGQRGGAEAAKQRHGVVMSPTQPVYFDYAQAKPDDSLVWGGYNPVDSVYAFEPVPRTLDSAFHRYILGGQANVWTEYMTNPAKVEYMILPRLAALSEVLWTPKEKRNWPSFEQRLPRLFARYDRMHWTASRAYYNLQPDLQRDSMNGGLMLRFRTRLANPTIVYTRNAVNQNTVPLQTYRDGILVRQSDSITVALLTPDRKQVHRLAFNFQFNKATAHKATLVGSPSRNYPGLGALSLVNGIKSAKGLASTDWLGFLGGDIDATIDLDRTQSISTVALHTLDQNGSWIYLPQSVEIQVSDDGQNFRTVGTGQTFVKDDPNLTQGWITVGFPPTAARYVRVFARNYGIIPEGQPGAGTKAWIFADEIRID